jgi:voltage-gated potassium channel
VGKYPVVPEGRGFPHVIFTNQTGTILMKIISFRDEKVTFRLLLAMVIGILLVAPLISYSNILNIVMDLFFMGTFFVVIRMLSKSRLYSILAGISGMTMVVSFWLHFLYPSDAMMIAAKVSGALFFLLVVITMLRHVVASPTVTREVLYAAMVVYLMIGILFAFVYGCIYIVDPASFDLTMEMSSRGWAFFYFSFVTLTTLGYGDSSPLTAMGGIVAVMEAIIGQLYLVVVVAWLVGMHVSSKSGRSTTREE